MTPFEAIERARVRLQSKPLDLMDVENLVNSVYREGLKQGQTDAFEVVTQFCKNGGE